MDSASKKSTQSQKSTKAGASKRKPAVTRHVVDDSLTENSADKDGLSPAEDEEMMDFDTKTKSNGEVNNVKGKVEDENSTSCEEEEMTYDSEGKVILPEGTVVVEPEEVRGKADDDFHGPEFACGLRRKFKGSVDDQIITCTACGRQVNHKMTAFLKKHPVLEVLMCRRCFNYYNSGTFSQDENGLDEYCRWCAEGGKLICCDTCHNAFCKECIRRNFGRKVLSEVMSSDNWKCFVCNPLPLQDLRDFCDIVLKNSESSTKVSSSKKPTRFGNSKKDGVDSSDDESVAETEVGLSLNKTLLAINMLRNRIQVLKSKVKSSVNVPSDLLRISKKFLRDVTVTKQNFKVIEKDVMKITRKYKSRARQALTKNVNVGSSQPINGCVSDSECKTPKSEVKTKPTSERNSKQQNKPVASSSNRRSFASRRSQDSRRKGIVSVRVRKSDLSSSTSTDDEKPNKCSSFFKKVSENENTTMENKPKNSSVDLPAVQTVLSEDLMDTSENKVERGEIINGETASVSLKNEVASGAEEMEITEDGFDASCLQNDASPSLFIEHSNNDMPSVKGKKGKSVSSSSSTELTRKSETNDEETSAQKSSRQKTSPKAKDVEQKSIVQGIVDRPDGGVDSKIGKSKIKSIKLKSLKEKNLPVTNKDVEEGKKDSESEEEDDLPSRDKEVAIEAGKSKIKSTKLKSLKEKNLQLTDKDVEEGEKDSESEEEDDLPSRDKEVAVEAGKSKIKSTKLKSLKEKNLQLTDKHVEEGKKDSESEEEDDLLSRDKEVSVEAGKSKIKSTKLKSLKEKNLQLTDKDVEEGEKDSESEEEEDDLPSRDKEVAVEAGKSKIKSTKLKSLKEKNLQLTDKHVEEGKKDSESEEEDDLPSRDKEVSVEAGKSKIKSTKLKSLKEKNLQVTDKEGEDKKDSVSEEEDDDKEVAVEAELATGDAKPKTQKNKNLTAEDDAEFEESNEPEGNEIEEDESNLSATESGLCKHPRLKSKAENVGTDVHCSSDEEDTSISKSGKVKSPHKTPQTKKVLPDDDNELEAEKSLDSSDLESDSDKIGTDAVELRIRRAKKKLAQKRRKEEGKVDSPANAKQNPLTTDEDDAEKNKPCKGNSLHNAEKSKQLLPEECSDPVLASVAEDEMDFMDTDNASCKSSKVNNKRKEESEKSSSDSEVQRALSNKGGTDSDDVSKPTPRRKASNGRKVAKSKEGKTISVSHESYGGPEDHVTGVSPQQVKSLSKQTKSKKEKIALSGDGDNEPSTKADGNQAIGSSRTVSKEVTNLPKGTRSEGQKINTDCGDDKEVKKDGGSDNEQDTNSKGSLSQKARQTKSISKKTLKLDNKNNVEDNDGSDKDVASTTDIISKRATRGKMSTAKKDDLEEASANVSGEEDAKPTPKRGTRKHKATAMEESKDSGEEHVKEKGLAESVGDESELESKTEEEENATKQANNSKNVTHKNLSNENSDEDAVLDGDLCGEANIADSEDTVISKPGSAGKKNCSNKKYLAEIDELAANELAKKKLLEDMNDSSDSEPSTSVINSPNGRPGQKVTTKKASPKSPLHKSEQSREEKGEGTITGDISGESSLSDSSIASDSDTMVKPLQEEEGHTSDESSDEDTKLNANVGVKLKQGVAGAKKKEKLATAKTKIGREKRKRQSTSESDIDKDLKRLSNLKSLKKRRKPSRPSESEASDEEQSNDGTKEKQTQDADSKSKKERKGEKKVAEQKVNTLLFTDSEEDNVNDIQDDELSDNEEKQKVKKEDIKIDKNLNDIAKEMLKEELISSEESDILSDSDVDDLQSKKKKRMKKEKKDDVQKDDSSSEQEKKKKKGDNSSDSSVEEVKVVKKKKKKQEPLLKYKLSDSDSDANSSSAASSNKKSKKKDANGKKGKTKGRKKGVVSDSDEDVVISDESGSESDASLSSLDDAFKKRKTRNAKKEEDKKKAAGKKRRRIKEIKDSSDGGEGKGSENDENDGTPSKGGRKKIRKIIKDSKLKDETKAAAREEEERRQRVAERQKMYNEAVVDKTKAGGPVTTKLVLDKNLETEEVLVEVHRKIIPNLKPHQVEGVKFLWDSVCESIDHMKNHPGSGCILAHCMGLGKTLQLITFIHTLLSNKRTRMKTTLVVCPLNTVLNWANEFDIWLKEDKLKLDVYELSSVKNNWGRADVLSGWHESGGVCIMGYDMFRNLVQEKGKRINKRQREIFQRTLIDPGPDLVVCDEGHILKNDATALAKAMNRVTTQRRIVLTGTPLQNNLSEYHCMVHFVKPNLLGTRKEFQNRFMNPIVNGQCADSTPHDFRLMKRRAHILHNLLDGCVQRRDYNVLTPFLPPKHEYVISVRLAEIQIKLYRHFLDNFARRLAGGGKGSGLFADYQALMKIWTHPYVLKLSDVRDENKVQYDSEDSFIDDESSESTSSESSTDVKCLNEPSSSKGRRTRGRKNSDSNNSGDEVIKNWTTRRQRGSGDEDVPEIMKESSKEWWTEFISEEDAQKVDLGGKLVLLLDILQECEAIGDKVLVFSQSLLSLDLIEIMLKRLDDKPEEPTALEKPEEPTVLEKPAVDSFNSWERGLDYFRMDGSTGADLRQRWTELFNSEDNTRARLFLISTRAGGLGINLVSANRVIIFDASWNPTHDVQSIFRVYRFGQNKPVYVYRFLAQGTMEEKIYDRQISKLSLACRVVDEQQIERHFNSSDLQELYNFDPDAKSKVATPMVPKDLLLAELLIRQKDWISGYHEHDSLLENKEGEELTEEERKAAWAEYEAEKKGLISATAGLGVLSPTGSLDINTIIEKIQEQWPGLTQDELNEKVSHVIMWLRHQQQQQQMQAIQAQRQQHLLQQQQQQQAFLQQQQQALRQQQHYAMLNEQYRQMAAAQMRFPAVNVNPATINPYLMDNRGMNASPVPTPPTTVPAASSPSQPETPAASTRGSSRKDKSKK